MNENAKTNEKGAIRKALENFGLPRLIITGFLVLLLILAPFVGADLPTQISNIIARFSWNGVLVLAMVRVAFFFMHRASTYNEAANNNASGVAVMMGVAAFVPYSSKSRTGFPESIYLVSIRSESRYSLAMRLELPMFSMCRPSVFR